MFLRFECLKYQIDFENNVRVEHNESEKELTENLHNEQTAILFIVLCEIHFTVYSFLLLLDSSKS